MNKLKLVDIKKEFVSANERITVLSGINLEIKRGEKIAIIGPSGSGKSTLLHLMGLLLSPTEGEIFIDDKSVSSMTGQEKNNYRNKDIGFVFQFHHLLPDFSSLENIIIPALIRGEDKNKAEERAKFLLDKVGIKDRMHHKPNQLSGGERQRVSICRALIMNPSVLLMDEPTGNLDFDNRNRVMNIIDTFYEDMDIGYVFITHNKEIIKNRVDKIYVLQKGIIYEEKM